MWAETLTVTLDIQGVFTVELGTVYPLSPAIFSGEPRFLGIKVGDDTEMEPRQVLTSAPYAMNANIASGAIYNYQINNSAAITPSKISGTAATLSGTQTITGSKTFTGNTFFFDSTMTITSNGVRIGDPTLPTTYDNLRIERNYNTSSYHYGIYTNLYNASNGTLYGVIGIVGNASGQIPSASYGMYGYTSSDATNRYGAYCYGRAANSSSASGTSYGVYAEARYGAGAYAGFFLGNAVVTGVLAKGAGTFKIDHPLDPENKYLQHSFVESPDMMNVYNGNVTTDAGGLATVELPEYFDALNKDFRYQLTVIGEFAQAIVAEEIENNQFTIRTDKPSVKVSWQVTGIRKDAFAEANRIQVEVEKPVNEKGLYLHPEAFQLNPEMQIHYSQNKKAQAEAMRVSEE
jgi:hypothetical protein